MELMNKEIQQDLPKLYDTENIRTENKILKVRYFAMYSNWEWYLVEYNKDTKIAFGYVIGQEKEWGYFSIEEFQQMNDDALAIIRDENFKEIKFGDLK